MIVEQKARPFRTAAARMAAAAKFECDVREDLHRRRWVRAHVFLIGLVTLGVLWGISHTLMVAGMASIALRHGIALLGAYVIYLGLLWVWCRWLLSRDVVSDGPCFGSSSSSPGNASSAGDPALRSGGGGDFGGGGASGSFDAPGSDGEAMAAFTDCASSAMESATSAAAEAISNPDEDVVVAVPVALAIGVAVALATVLGFAIFGLFGVELLVGVAVEIAFASAGGALALKAQREGWLGHAMRRTALPMTVVLAMTVVTGVAIGEWLPEAKTLPQVLARLF